MTKRTTPTQHWDRFIGWCMMLAGAAFIGNIAWQLVGKI